MGETPEPSVNSSIPSMILPVWKKSTGEQQGAGFEEQQRTHEY
ncbi:MAG: hypothetical protein NWQ28_11425 [Nodularia sp. (in: cyanobacteria)]|nr:hypothetical protein [Nodularia sp. (in: cyanobacteria)]